MMLNADDLATVQGSALFRDAPQAALDDMLAHTEIGDYRNHQVIFRPGRLANRVYLVLRGKVQVYRGEAAGKHAVLGVLQRGAGFGVEDVLEAKRHAATAEAVSACRVLEIRADAFLDAVANHPAFATGLLKLLSRSLHQVSDQLERIQLKPTAQRLADYLLRLVTDPAKCAELTLPYEKALIAAYLGMEPESLSRALKDLQAVGVTNRGRHIRIENPDALRDFSRATPGPLHAT